MTRSQLRWFRDREPHNPRGRAGRTLYKLAYPAVGYGPPLLNRVVLRPDLFPVLPQPVRRRITRRVLRAGGSPWLRTFVENNVRVSERSGITHVERVNGSLLVRLSDGSEREVDDVVVACGYRFDLDKLEFLAPDVRRGGRGEGRLAGARPVLPLENPRLLFVGYPAEARFGPLSRFVMGARFTAPRVAELCGR